MARGVGKTYEVLRQARRRKHGRKETQSLLRGLDVPPRRPIEHQGRTLLELDIDGALERQFITWKWRPPSARRISRANTSWGPDSLMRLELNARLQLAAARPNISSETLFSFLVDTYVSRGSGVAVVDPLAASFVDPDRVVIRTFTPPIPYPLLPVYPPAERRSAPLEDFANILRAAYQAELLVAANLCGGAP